MTTEDEVFFVNMSEEALIDGKALEIRFDEREEVSCIRSCIGIGDKFFVIANKKQGCLGYFLFSIDMNDPHGECRYYINWDNKLDIADVGLDFMKEKLANG